MSQHLQWINIEGIINGYIDASEQSSNKYYKLFQIAVRGVENLGLDFFYQVKSVKLPVNANLTVTIPSDYIKYTKVGVLNSKGEVIPLKYNSKLTTYADLFSDRLTKTQDDSLYNWYSWDSPIFYNYWNGYAYSNLYGIPSGTPFIGSFKIDNANGVILLDESFPYEYVMLEYIASPQVDGDYYIPVDFKEALLAWIAWQDIQNMPASRKGSLGDKRDRRSNYYNERRLALGRFRPFYMDEAYQSSQEATRLTVKS